MRYQLAAVDLDVGTYLPKIIASKHLKTRELLNAVQIKVINLCGAYTNKLNMLNTPAQQNWDAETIEALKSCYSVSTQALSAHKDAILKSLKAQSEINIQRCAYCMLNDPKTWDHYIPKDNFPEYSVFHENLVYACYGCNQRKSNFFEKTHLIYCHPYFTVHIKEPLLHCEINVVNGRLSINYYGGGSGELGEAGTIAHHHLVKLGLIERFKIEAASTVSGLIGELRQYYPDGVSQPTLDKVLRRRYAEAKEKLGCNAWDSRLWHGLAACEKFLEYANRKISKPGGPDSEGFRQISPPPPI